MSIEKRSIGVAILLSIITCGIYFYFWLYKIADDLYRVNGEESSAGMDILLSIVTCGIYYIYLSYKLGKLSTRARIRYNLYQKDDSVLFLILAVLGLGVINLCIIQDDLNREIGDAFYTAQVGYSYNYQNDQNNNTNNNRQN